MTVSYTGDVANGSSFGCFWKILGRWRGSVYKLIWRELIAYLFLYFVINAMYRLGMTEDQRRTFEKVKVYCSKQIESIPMSFVLGFYVTLIVKRWWDQYWILPMPDSLALYISASLKGQDERARLLRRTIMRYAMLAYVICLQRISFRVKKRFPTIQHLVDTGLMTDNEKKIYELMDQKTKMLKFWMPVVWASNLIMRARKESKIESDQMVQTIVTELSDFRRKLGRVMVYDTVSVPLVYTQVVTLAVYTYFLAALIGRQWVCPPDPSKIYPGYELDLYFPIFLSLQFIFYIGWLKVAETLINPFGEDDDDFELNWLIDRHIKVSYMVVDEMHEEHPELLKDQYWDEVVPQDIPYTIASEHYRRTEPQGSTAALKVKTSESMYADLTSVKRHSTIPDEVYADYESVTDSPLPDSRKNWVQRQWSRVGSLRSTTSSSGRNRTPSHGHGPLPLNMPPNSGHRPSLYERILSRRSSKDNRNSNRYLPNRALNGTLSMAKEGNYTLMANPNSRPRVPTPDVTKENQINLQSQTPIDKLPNRALYSNDASVMTQTFVNPGYGSPSGNNSTTMTFPQNGVVQPSGASPMIMRTSYLTKASQPARPISQREMLPPPYDANENMLDKESFSPSPSPVHGASILSPIAENDGSPYSTSSTTRSNRSSNYPTTTSIFGLGRKQSPPPHDELPPIPIATSSHTGRRGSGSSSSSGKSDHSSNGKSRRRLSNRRRGVGSGTDHAHLGGLTQSATVDDLDTVLKETVFDGRINNGFEPDEQDDLDSSRDYMTISEVKESRAELEKDLQQSQNKEQSVTFKAQDPPPPSLPHPRPVPGTFAIAQRSRGSMLPEQSSPFNKSGLAVPGSSSIELATRGKRGTLSTSMGHGSPSNLKDDLEADDGYDEKGSYNDDEDFSHSIIVANPNDNSNNSSKLNVRSCDAPELTVSTVTPPTSSSPNQEEVSPSIETNLGSLEEEDVEARQTTTPSPTSSSGNDNNNTLYAKDNETVLLLSPKDKKKKKGKDKKEGTNSKTNGESESPSDPLPEKTPEVSKDCEVFV